MDEDEFHRLLDMFPVVRSPHHRFDSDTSQSTSQNKTEHAADSDRQDAFWEKLRFVAEKKLGPMEAKRFCDAFQRVHRKLVYEELSLDAACSLLNSITTSG
ncbi:hypothetical protein M5689_002777 [Euphorbia peplus]|nr:hypothetical protein M5689_002777 [Euphorbia peplus]